MTEFLNIFTPPIYCQYTLGPCDQDLSSLCEFNTFFIYPSNPVYLSDPIKEAVKKFKENNSIGNWKTWEDLNVGGKIIFCEICKAIRSAKVVVADITSLNFNVLFEIGFAYGLGKFILPIKDSSYEEDSSLISEIGIFDTLGYEKYSNSEEIFKIVEKIESQDPPVAQIFEINKQQPFYYIKAPTDSDAGIKILSCLKKSAFRFRTFDIKETSRLSLHEAYKQAMSSVSVVAHLINPSRKDSKSHNARSAFVCGIALAAGKHVLMLHEGFYDQPIDYRDIIVPYEGSAIIPNQIEKIVRATAETFQNITETPVSLPKNLIERLDLGDIAAENEITPLIKYYFVKTPQFQQVRQGHARLVIGRKGTGKTALFYGIRSQFKPRKDKMVIDLKPEGHQFSRLREFISGQLSSGMQEHTLATFWHYLLLIEILGKIIDKDSSSAYSNKESLEEFEKLEKLYKKHGELKGDFSERLMTLVNRLINQFPKKSKEEIIISDITSIIYEVDINVLNDAIINRLYKSEGLWILMDNIDKGFPSHGLTETDILIVRGLLEATRKIESSFRNKQIDCLTTIFLRRDVYDYLIDKSPDRGKETHANLDWSDIELIKELLIKRFQYEIEELNGDFDEVWRTIFESHVGGESSFTYITSRTFLRPRDILNFVRKCIQVAVSHNHLLVSESDIITAEKEYSDDMLNELSYEMRDIFPNLPDILTCFLGVHHKLSKDEIYDILLNANVESEDWDKVIEILLWFSFLGVTKKDEEYFAFQKQYNIKKLLQLIHCDKPDVRNFVIHPGFRLSISI